MDLNKVMLIGRLPQDPELRNLPSGSSVASFSIATGRQWTDKDGQRQKQTEFHRIAAWGKLAETASMYLFKGKQVYIEGRLQTHDWTGQDGVKRYRTEIVADNFIMLGAKPLPDAQAATAPRKLRSQAEQSDEPQEVIEEVIQVEEIPV